MILYIKLINYKASQPGQENTIEIDESGGSIGRGTANRIFLPDPDKYISRSHANIYYENGHYHLKDCSLGGTFLVNQNLVLHGNAIQLNDGDKIRIGEYDLVVSLSETNGNRPSSDFAGDDELNTPFFDSDNSDWLDQPVGMKASSGLTEDALISDEDEDHLPLPVVDTFLLDDSSFDPPIVEQSFATGVIAPDDATTKLPDDFSITKILEEMTANQVPSTKPPHCEISNPVETEQKKASEVSLGESPLHPLENDSMPQPASEAVPSVPSMPEVKPKDVSQTDIEVHGKANDPLIEVFLDAAGIKDRTMVEDVQNPTIMKIIGILFREIVSGLVLVLRGRTEMKRGFHIDNTVVKSNGNNPLKFSPSVDDALVALLKRKHTGFMDPVAAVRGSYKDIMHHQMAMNAGMQAALKDLLKRFDPSNIERFFSEGIVFQKKSKCWDKYCQSYREMVDETIDDIFGEAFSRAYQEQIQRLTPLSDVNSNKDG